MNILIDSPAGRNRDIYFPEGALKKLKNLGNVILNNTTAPFSESDMEKHIINVDICITHWDTPVFSDTVIRNADKLKLIAHAAGSVANLVSENVYRRGIIVRM